MRYREYCALWYFFSVGGGHQYVSTRATGRTHIKIFQVDLEGNCYINNKWLNGQLMLKVGKFCNILQN